MDRDALPSSLPQLSYSQRAHVFDSTVKRITGTYFDPSYRGTNWPEIAQQRRESILRQDDPEQFESANHDLVRSLGTSHTGFFHESLRRVPGRLAIGATFVKAGSEGGERWIIREVHEQGPAHKAGLVPLDVLISVRGRVFSPPEQPMFSMNGRVTVVIERNGNTMEVPIDVPAPRSREQPYSEPTPVLYRRLADSIGYLKVSILPGLIGIDVSRDLDRAFSQLADCNRLILDLRGHLGGGLGVLRLMSHLTADKLPIGYTVTRKMAERGYDKARLPRLDRLPSTKVFGIAALALKYAGRDQSVALVSEGLGPKRCHGRIVILANEGTVSAGEMVCAFARERGLATIVGTETAGRLIPGSGFKVGHGYRVIIPKAAYITWAGETFEGRGIQPDIYIPWSPELYGEGRDGQLEKAIEVVRSL